MRKLPLAARIYILTTLALTLVLVAGAAVKPVEWQADPALFAFLLIGAITAQYFTVVTPKHQHYYLTPAFFFAGIVLLDPVSFALLVALAHVPEWIKVKYPWYIQSFNIAAHALAGFVGRVILLWLLPASAGQLLSTGVLSAILTAAMVYILVNHLLVGIVLMLARNVGLRESQVFSPANLLTDLALACVGATMALLWQVQPWLVVFGTAPLILIHRALSIPALREEAQVDSKTGLYNNMFFSTSMADELRRARRFGRPLAVIMADLDDLTHINNTYGHLAGDAALAALGKVIREQVREYDVAARFGGEEFTLLMPETTTHEGYVVAERIRKAVESTPIQIPTRVEPIYVTITAGVASYPSDGHEAEHLIHAADVAMYQGKAAGKNRVRMSTPHEGGEPPTLPSYISRQDSEVLPPPLTHRRNSGYGSAAASIFVAIEPTVDIPAPAVRPPQMSRLAWIYLFSAAALATFLMAFYLPSVALFDTKGLIILAAFAAAAELFSVDLYGASRVSVSFVAIFAAAIMYGPVGAVVVGPVIAISHWIKRRPRGYQVFFNAANHVISSTVAGLVFSLSGVKLRPENLLLVLVPVLLAGLANYLASTMLLSGVLGLSERKNPLKVWSEQFRWLAAHYLVMATLALFFALAYLSFDIWGILAFLAPLMIMRYAQKQHVDQTVQNVAALRKVNEELAHANEEIQMINDELLMTLARAIDARDPYVYGHSARVAEYAVAIAREMNLPPERVKLIRRAALLHDVGKIGLPEHVLNKRGDLTEYEFEIMKQHTLAADDILSVCHQLQGLVPIVRAHHERWDGAGYPDQRAGEDIPLEARILALADAVEAMASERTYHHAKPAEEIVAEVNSNAGTQFDPQVAAAFTRVVRREGPEFIRNSAQEASSRASPSWRRFYDWSPGELQTDAHQESNP
jgi:diguanylate cyclase (GGDEF)-like protein/putative nucleotidyltransferase with HDIG domain